MNPEPAASFNLVETLLGFTLLGAEWILWLLVALSILSVAIMFERFLYFQRIRFDFADFTYKLSAALSSGDWDTAHQVCASTPALAGQVALRGLNFRDKGARAVEGSMEGMALGERQKIDRGLVVLGTLGNNAPFIGLFGTIVGIIKAFHDLAHNPDGGPSVVMQGISEALVATAVGLLVALPAVIAFNTFQRLVKSHMANTQATMKLLLTHID